ncbi:hypothetical protein SLA2020_188980 [Shorea laevis]
MKVVSFSVGILGNNSTISWKLPKNTLTAELTSCTFRRVDITNQSKSTNQQSAEETCTNSSQHLQSLLLAASSTDPKGEDEYCENSIECQMKPVFVLSNPDPMFNPSHITNTHPMSSAQYPYADAYYGGLLTPYGQHVLPQMGPQMVGTPPTRIPLPFDLAEDGPIYVNPKQYHGILRRRQFRAKLEAKNKLVKTRKPYLHESRHRHALNRVRGSGGRFLSTKNLQQPDQKNGNSEFESQCLETVEYVGLMTTCPDISTSNGDVNFRQPEHRSSGISPHAGANMQSIGNLMSNGTKHNVR